MEYTLITGASSGVGRQLAVQLSKTRNVILNGRNQKRLEETRDKCEKDALIWAQDLSETSSIESSIDGWLKEHEVRVDSFIHCAGIMKLLPIRAVTADTLIDVFGVNVFSSVLIVKKLASRKTNGRSLKSIVFISSNISNRGASAFSTYGSSKAALDGLMRNLAIELAPSVRVNSVLPGGMVTDMTQDIFADEQTRDSFERNYPLGIGTPDDIAPVVEFLISDASRWMTGQQVTVDGGRTIDITERGM